jgi:hypothetical protein
VLFSKQVQARVPDQVLSPSAQVPPRPVGRVVPFHKLRVQVKVQVWEVQSPQQQVLVVLLEWEVL